MNYAHLVDVDHQAIQAQVLEDQKRRTTSCKSLHKGGAISVADAGKKRDNRNKKERDDAVRKAQLAINRYVNKAKKELKAQGVQARKNEKNRKKRLQEFLVRGEELSIGIDVPIPDPEKNPSDADLEALLPHPSLLEALNELSSGPRPRVVLGREGIREIVATEASSARPGAREARLGPTEEDDDEVEMVTEVIKEEPDQVDLEDSSGSEPKSMSLADSSDAASRLSDDSITRNADFIAFS